MFALIANVQIAIVVIVHQAVVAVKNVNALNVIVVIKTMSDQENQWIEKAWNEFSGKLLSYIRTKVDTVEDAEDILQNVFIKVGSNIDSFDPNSNLNAWLFTITKHKIIDYYRSKRMVISLDDHQKVDVEVVDEPLDDPFCCLDEHISCLPEKYGTVIVQSEIMGIKHKDIAKRLGISLSAVKSRVVRGRVLLKDKFVQCCKYKLNKQHKLVGESGCESDGCNC